MYQDVKPRRGKVSKYLFPCCYGGPVGYINLKPWRSLMQISYFGGRHPEEEQDTYLDR